MKSINIIGGKVPESTERKAAFEIVIRTHDPVYRANGGPEEKVIPCEGYWLAVTVDDGQRLHAQGKVDTAALAAGVFKNVEPEALIAGLAMRDSGVDVQR